MKTIPLTQGKVAIVDDEDFERVSAHKWCYEKTGYAMRKLHADTKQTTVRMHRFVMNAPSNITVDHINGDCLDNRKANLRLCSQEENIRNRRRHKNNSCAYKGVRERNHRWQARIRKNGKEVFIGTFDSAVEAAQAYDTKAIELFGEFAKLNFLAE